MSTIYMSQLSTALPLMEGDHHHHQDHHQHQGHFQAFTLPKDPPILFPFVITSNSNNPSDNGLVGYGSDHHLRQQHHAMLDQPQHMIGGSSSVFAATPFPTVESIRDDMIERSSSFDPYDIDKLHAASGSAKGAGKWSTAASAPAKMRITRKASDPGVGGPPAKKPRRRAQAYEDCSHNSGMNQTLGVIRVCSDCNTTKTPLWRSGPCGPKSLCNACGIRQRKARRAMMASGAAAASTDGSPKAAPALGDAAAAAHPKVKKEKRVDVDRSLPFKKRCKVVQDHTAANTAAAAAPVPVTAAAAPAMDLSDSMAIKWSKSPTTAVAAACFQPSPPAFPVQDEITDAAMLLMTLSCELVRS